MALLPKITESNLLGENSVRPRTELNDIDLNEWIRKGEGECGSKILGMVESKSVEMEDYKILGMMEDFRNGRK